MRPKSLSVIVFSVFAMHFVGVPTRADAKLAEPTEVQLEAAKKTYARFGGELIPYKHPVSSVIYAQFNFDKKKATLNDEDLKNLPDLPIAFMLDFESCAKVTDAGLKHLTKLKNLYGLGLRGTQTTDLGLRELKALTNLTDMVLGQTKITDDGLKELKGLKNLTILWLHDTSVTDAGVKELKDLKNLTVLSLGVTKVTDAGLKEIKNLTNLKSLELVGTQVTDAGLKELTGLKNLLELNLSKTRVTNKGVQELQRDLPKCEITATTGEALSIPKPEPIRHRLNDCHLHLVDFLQRTDGIKPVTPKAKTN